MTSTRHKWGERDEVSPQRTLYHCKRCGMIKVSRHEFEGAFPTHWKEFWIGTDRADDGDGKTPPCDARLDAEAVPA